MINSRTRSPEVVLRNGRPAAVIPDITHYEELLERAEDAADLKRLRKMRKEPQRFRGLGDVPMARSTRR